MKKLFLSIVCLMAGLSSMGQVSYKVTYKGGEDGKLVYLNNGETRQVLDSAVVMGGEVAFIGQVAEPVAAVLHTHSGQIRGALYEILLDDTPVVVENEKLQSGSALNKRYAEYQERNRAHNKEAEAIVADYRALQEEFGADIPEEKMEALQNRMQEFSEQSHQLSLQMLEDNRDNLIPLLTLMYNADALTYPYVADYLKTYHYADRETLAPLKAMLKKEEVKLPGAKVVDFTMKNLNGETVSLTDWVGKGNYVLVDFWASWCGPCRQDMPHVKALYGKYHPLGFEIVGVSLDSKQEAWEKGVHDLGITWPQMSDLKYWQSEGASLYNIRAIPATILFAPDGTVVEAGLRGETLTKKLEEIYEQKK